MSYLHICQDREVQVKGGRDLLNLMSDEVVLSMYRWLYNGTLAR